METGVRATRLSSCKFHQQALTTNGKLWSLALWLSQICDHMRQMGVNKLLLGICEPSNILTQCMTGDLGLKFKLQESFVWALCSCTYISGLHSLIFILIRNPLIVCLITGCNNRSKTLVTYLQILIVDFVLSNIIR